MTQNPPNDLAKSVTSSPRDTEAEGTLAGQKLFYFRPETGEILVFDEGEAAEAVRREGQLLDDLLQALGESRERLCEAREAYEAAKKNRLPADPQPVKTALDHEQRKREALLNELKELQEFNQGSKLMELLPLANGRDNKPMLGGKKFTYVRSSKIKNHWRSYKLSGVDKPEMKSFLSRDRNGRWQIDRARFVESMTQLADKVKVAEKTIPLWLPEAWSPSFVDGFNEALRFGQEPSDQAPDDVIAFSGEAQLLRFIGGASLSMGANLSPAAFTQALKGNGSAGAEFKLQGSLGFQLAEGKLSADLYFPKRAGLELFIPAPVSDLTLGYFRLKTTGSLHGACGASVLGEGGAEFKLARDNSKQGLRGSPYKRTVEGVTTPRLQAARNNNAAGSAQPVEATGDMGVNLTAFAGVQSGASIAGAMEWQEPETVKFEVFAKIEPTLTGQIGGGGSASFYITYQDGLFRVKAKLGACVGVGLKGEVLASVGVGEIVQFAWWVKTQIANAGEQYLDYFETETFEFFAKLKALAILEGQEALKKYLGSTEAQLRRKLVEWIARGGEAVRRIKDASDDLVNAPAETKAILVDMLHRIGDQANLSWSDVLLDPSRWEWPDWQMPDMVPDWRPDDYLPELPNWRLPGGDRLYREIMGSLRNLLSANYIVPEMNNVFQHANADGAKMDATQIAAVEDWVRRASGVDTNALRQQLKQEPTPGYKLTRNTSPSYRLKRGVHIAWQRRSLMAPDDTRFV
ncbi:hypothetical protein C84B14_17573 [Salinisphaera sp. C84B14]|uniref:hypothetical protein n=1 Tax=Salinisphaera sp. C84B14 TaxID=1304155 RepID=UPI00333E33A2